MGVWNRAGAAAEAVSPRRWLLPAAALPLAAVLAVGGAVPISLPSGTPWTTTLPGVVLYLAAFGLLVLGRSGQAVAGAATGAASGDSAAGDPAAPRLLSGRVEWTLVALIVLVGLLLRLWAIDVIPT